MSTYKRSVPTSFTALALLLASAAPACSSFGNTDRADDSADAAPPGQQPSGSASDAGDAGGPKAEEVTGTPDNDSITEEKGVFVSPSGNDSADASRARPLKTLSAAITTAARAGKIVFACTGTYAEAIVVADSISIIGGLDCADPMRWKTGADSSRIVAPTSPAVSAKQITAPTRLERLEIIAPDATAASASSIGLFADHSPSITIVGSTITAGKGANGADGAAAIKPQEKGSPGGGASPVAANCTGNAFGINPCKNLMNVITNVSGGFGGTSMCVGASGNHNGTPGGVGGAGGIWQVTPIPFGPDLFIKYNGLAGGQPGGSGFGSDGGTGIDGTPPAPMGTLTADGYVAADGSVASDGFPGSGGAGGYGGDDKEIGLPAEHGAKSGEIWRGVGGPGGGAGGCPGLAGGAGAGGGASLGLALIESPLILDGVQVTSSTGGTGGHGAFSSSPLSGGGAGLSLTQKVSAQKGGRGGFAGASTNGGSGPSIGILLTGAAPVLKGNSKATHGGGGAAIEEHASPFVASIKATPAGIEADMKTL